jgi:NAD+ kinase
VHTKIHFMGSAKPAAQQAVQQLIDRYGQSEIAAASYVVTVGGDGTALRALHALLPMREKAVFAMRLPDSVDALGNPFHLENLAERLRATRRTSIRLLTAEATLLNGDSVTGLGSLSADKRYKQPSSA